MLKAEKFNNVLYIGYKCLFSILGISDPTKTFKVLKRLLILKKHRNSVQVQKDTQGINFYSQVLCECNAILIYNLLRCKKKVIIILSQYIPNVFYHLQRRTIQRRRLSICFFLVNTFQYLARRLNECTYFEEYRTRT